MIAETLAGISLFKAAVDGIKRAIGTANDVSDIASYIDGLFEGEKQVQQLRSKKSGVGGVADQFGVKSVATEVINAKLAEEKMREIASMVDMRFGHGTWKGITEERAKRIREAREDAAQARREKLKKAKELEDNIKMGIGIFSIVLIVVGLFMFLMISIAKAFV